MALSEIIDILLIEDDDGHAMLVEKNLRRAGLTNRILRFCDGQEGLDYFFDPLTGATNGRRNCVILLDINMPRVGGIEVLRRIKADTSTNSLPVIMLTTTDDPREVERSYELGCNIYITKPVEYDAFIESIRRLGFFLQVVRLPGLNSVT